MKPFPTSAACCFGILFISVSLITTGSSEVQVVGSADPVVALAGDDIILPCFLKPRVNAKDMVVKWTRFNLTTTEDVHLYRDGRVDHFPSYSERTSMFHEELKNGNVSLKLTRVTLSDAGSYRCFIPTLTSQVKETTVQLFVGAVSQPVISIDGTKGWGVVLKCESGGWFPEPEMVWLDSSGSILPADGPPERPKDSEGLYTVIRHVTVDKTDTNRFTCIVQQPEINHLKETEIHVPDEVFPKSQVGLIVGLITAAVGVLAASAVGVYMWRKHKEKKHEKELEEQEELSMLNEKKLKKELEEQEKKLKKELEEQEKKHEKYLEEQEKKLKKELEEQEELRKQKAEVRMQKAEVRMQIAKFKSQNEFRKQKAEVRMQIAEVRMQNAKFKSQNEFRKQKEELRRENDPIRMRSAKFKSQSAVSMQNEEVSMQNDQKRRWSEEVILWNDSDEEELYLYERIQNLSGQLDQVRRERAEVRMQKDEAIRERDELKEKLRKAEETIQTLKNPSTSPGGQQKTQTPSQKSEGIEDEGMEMESLPDSGRKSLLGPGMEMRPLLGSGPQKDDLDEMERGGRV